MSTVVHRKSFEVVKHANTPDYDPNTWLINPDMSKVSGFDKKYWMVRGDELVPMTEAARKKIEESEIDDIKARRYGEFESNTQLAVGAGFEYPAGSNKKIALSDTDRITLNGLAVHDFPAEVFPVVVTGMNGREVSLNGLDDVKALIKADIAFRIGAKRAELELKRRVREAQTIEAVKFVADRRV